jgi:molybdate transport system ATP-binding protein
MSVLDNLRFGWRRARHANTDMLAEIIALLGLESLVVRKPANLSGGERRRVALGRALLSDPALLLLDEPLVALDQARREEILPYLERLRDRARLPIFYVTHSVEELSRLADQVVVFNAGRVTCHKSVFDLLSDLEFSSLTGVPAYGSVLSVNISQHRDQEGLTMLAFNGGELVVPRIDLPVGSSLRVRVRAEDVLLALEALSAISANNVLAATVTDVQLQSGIYADVQLACGKAKLVARITRYSLQRLNIVAGMSIFAIVKSVTIDSRMGVPQPQSA